MGKPRCSKTYESSRGNNSGMASTLLRFFLWIFSSKRNKDDMIRSWGQNQKTSKMQNKTLRMAPRLCTTYCNENRLEHSTWSTKSIPDGSCLRKSIVLVDVFQERTWTISLSEGWGHYLKSVKLGRATRS